MPVKDCPRFLLENLNAEIAPVSADDAFQSFLEELLDDEYPGLIGFPTRGRDGGIDLSHSVEATADGEAGTRTVLEGKFVESETIDLATSRRKWGEVFDHLHKNLSDPGKGQSQYGPWLRRDPRISKYVFCVSARLANQNIRDELTDKIKADLAKLSKAHEDLSHLSEIDVKILDWGDIGDKLMAKHRLLYRWFKNVWPLGFMPLDAQLDPGGFGSTLRTRRFPTTARKTT